MVKKYRHYKGGLYISLSAEAIHTETKEKMVVYCNAEKINSPVYVRPYDIFHGYLDNGVKRFTQIED
jgi:hypothetical protein